MARNILAIFSAKNLQKLNDSSEEAVNKIYQDWALMQEVLESELLFTPILDEDTGKETGMFSDGPVYIFFKAKYAHEPEWLSYMEESHLYNHTARCWGPAGEPSNTNTTESGNRVMKLPENLRSVEAAATLEEQVCLTGTRLSRASSAIALCPADDQATWKKSQKLVEQGYCLLSCSFGKKEEYKDFVVLPSTNLLKHHIPEDLKTVNQQVAHMKVWLKEFCEMKKKGADYVKWHNGSWNFDIAMDMYFSFWILEPIRRFHPRCAPIESAQHIARFLHTMH